MSASAVAWTVLAVWALILLVDLVRGAWVAVSSDIAEDRRLDEACRRRIEQRRMADEACAVDAARVKDEDPS